MRIAVFGDIHGNLPALRAALVDMRAQGAEAFVCLGDVAMDGVWPRECVAEVAALGCPVVRGNADWEMLEAPGPFTPRGLPDERELWEIGNWSRTQLTNVDRDVLRTYAPTVSLPDLLCFHGSPARDDEELGARTPEDRLEDLRAAHGQQGAWVGGHTHKPLLRTLDGWTLLNPGSVGLPFERRNGKYVNLARAEYLLLDQTSGGWQVIFRAVPYSVGEVQRGILASGMPHAAWVAGDWVAG
ncbi:metallophosphoesterase family protein [Deinococcus apachensis]|uniref:metallophosphoesterase family protein n=1 Tax=Deinococcus apachensis TaxID=309886 RepID=UPI00037AD348|nr:metallophosphoesterase family protein [Deinococcus apachensis]